MCGFLEYSKSFFRTTHQATLESKDSMFRKGRIKPEKKVMPRVALRECFLLCLVLLLSYWPYTWEFLLLADAIFLSLKSLVTGILLEHAYLFLIVFVIYFFFFSSSSLCNYFWKRHHNFPADVCQHQPIP